jgi:hypothetical protein
MKIALILTGYSRTYKECYENTKKFILDAHDVDVYLSTWNKTQSSFLQPQINSFDVNDLIRTYNPVKYRIEDYDSYYGNRFPSIDIESNPRPDDIFKTNARAIEHGSKWVERLRDQWYIVKKGWELIDDPSKYDYVMRLRLDTRINNMVFDYNPKDLIVPNKFNPFTCGTIIADHMVIGNPKNMEKYCKIFDSIESMYHNDNIDISFAELMLGHHLNNILHIKPVADSRIDYDNLR